MTEQTAGKASGSLDPNGDLEFLQDALIILRELPPEHRLQGVRAMRVVVEHAMKYGGVAGYNLDYLQSRAASEGRHAPPDREPLASTGNSHDYACPTCPLCADDRVPTQHWVHAEEALTACGDPRPIDPEAQS